MEENRIPKRVLYMHLGTTRLSGRPTNRWQDEVREDGRIVGGEGWQEKVHNRQEWKKLLRMARNRRILHMPMEWMNEKLPCIDISQELQDLQKKYKTQYVFYLLFIFHLQYLHCNKYPVHNTEDSCTKTCTVLCKMTSIVWFSQKLRCLDKE